MEIKRARNGFFYLWVQFCYNCRARDWCLQVIQFLAVKVGLDELFDISSILYRWEQTTRESVNKWRAIYAKSFYGVVFSFTKLPYLREELTKVNMNDKRDLRRVLTDCFLCFIRRVNQWTPFSLCWLGFRHLGIWMQFLPCYIIKKHGHLF